MDIRNRLLAPVAIQDRQNRVTSVDLGAFLIRLLLFDTYIIHSIWLEDLILLQHSFGTNGLCQLFEMDTLKFQCTGVTFGQTGQMANPSLPFFNYEFSVIKIQDAEQRIHRVLSALDPALREQLIRGRLLIPEDYPKTVFDVLYRDLGSTLLDAAVRGQLRRAGIIPISHHVKAEHKGGDHFVVENDLSLKYRLPDADAHRMIESVMMAIGGLDERIASIQAYSALTGLEETQSALLSTKLGTYIPG